MNLAASIEATCSDGWQFAVWAIPLRNTLGNKQNSQRCTYLSMGPHFETQQVRCCLEPGTWAQVRAKVWCFHDVSSVMESIVLVPGPEWKTSKACNTYVICDLFIFTLKYDISTVPNWMQDISIRKCSKDKILSIQRSAQGSNLWPHNWCQVQRTSPTLTVGGHIPPWR